MQDTIELETNTEHMYNIIMFFRSHFDLKHSLNKTVRINDVDVVMLNGRTQKEH